MKVLLAVMMSTVLTGTAFAGTCAKSSPQECTTQTACEALSSEGQRFRFDATQTIKCQVVDTSVATNCLENNSSSIPRDNTGAPGAVVTPGSNGGRTQ